MNYSISPLNSRKAKRSPLSLIPLFALLSILSSLSSGCTQNDGHIGIFFGSWTFEEISVDGEPLPGYQNGDLMIAFQSHLWRMDSENNIMYGTWEEQDNDILIIDGSADHLTGTLPPLLQAGENGILRFLILKKSRKDMTWQRVDDSGRTWTYKLHKML